MKDVEIKICLGTTCFIKGKSILQKLSDIIPKKYGDKVKVSGCNCLGLSSIDWENTKAPYIKINDEIIKEANIEKVLEVLDKKIFL